jgi:Dolichyl-phosphate-mannose-protein mannosyltransferase
VTQPTAPTKLSVRLQGLALALLSAAPFASGVRGAFVLDDKVAIVRNPVVQGTVPLLQAFTRNFWGEALDAAPPSYRPLATLSFALDRLLFGDSPLAFHVSSLLCYVALVLVGWLFARRCMPPLAAWLAMAFFAVMPTHAENVASLVGRADTLAVLLCALALLALAPTLAQGAATPLWRVVLAVLAFGAALLCKESVAPLPVIVLLFVEYRRRRADSPLPRLRAHAATAGMFAVLAAYVVLRLAVQPEALSYTAPDDVLAGATFWEQTAYGFELLARYARLVAAPVDLCTGRKFAEVFRPAGVSLLFVAGLALLAAGVYASWRAYRRGGFPFVAAALLAWLLITGVVFAMPESMADRFLLLPSFFLWLALGSSLAAAWNSGRLARGLVVGAVAAQVVLSGAQAATWRDEGRLLAHAVRACPNSLHNHYRYAEYLSEQGQYDEALWHYAVFTSGRHAFPHAWTHPAAEAERTMSADQRLRDMHGLLHVRIDEATWRARFVNYLRSLGRRREAQLLSGLRPEPMSAPQ